MSFYRLYIGDASTCNWDAPAWNHFNLPKGIIDLGGIGLGACVTAYDLIEKYGGRLTSW